MQRERDAAALLDYSFCSLLSTHLKKCSAEADIAYRQLESIQLQGMEISWYSNKDPRKVYRNSTSVDPFELQSVKLHHYMDKSLGFKYSSRGDIFSTGVTIRLVTEFCNSAPKDDLALDDFGIYIKFDDPSGKSHRKFLFTDHIDKNFFTVRDVRDYYTKKGMVIKDLRFIDYKEFSGNAMDNTHVREWYQKFRNRKKVQEREMPITDTTTKKGGGNGILICIGLSVVIMFFMAYMASVYDINEENYWANYKVLDLETTATPNEVKKQFRLLSKTYHPDKNPNCEDCQKRMAEIETAKTSILNYLKQKGEEVSKEK